TTSQPLIFRASKTPNMINTLSLHDALPIFPNGHFLVVLDHDEAAIVCDYIRNGGDRQAFLDRFGEATSPGFDPDQHLVRVGCARSEEHTSELQSRENLVCRLLLEKKK